MGSSNHLRVLLYTHEFPPFKAGAGNYCAHLAAALQSHGVFVHVLAPAYPELPSEKLLFDERCVSRFADVSAIRNGWRMLWLVLRYRITHVVFGDAGAIIDLLVTPKPEFIAYSLVAHGTEILKYLHPLRSELDEMERDRLRHFVSGAQAIIHSNNAILGLIDESGLSCDRCLLAYPAVEPGTLPPPTLDQVQVLKGRYGIGDEPVVLSVARLAADKGQDVLLKAFSRVLVSHPDAKLIIGGDGPMRSTLESLANDLNIEKSVRFAGQIPAHEMSAHHQLSSFFAMASRSIQRFEGFGIVYIEAALCERTSVAGNQGGVPEAVEDGVTGLLVDPTDANAVAKAIVRLLDDPAYRNLLAKAALERALAQFNLRKMGEDLLERKDLFIGPFPGHAWKIVSLAAWIIRLLLKSVRRLPHALRIRISRR